MEAYRSRPTVAPLLSLVGGRLLALHGDTGGLVWERPVIAVERVLVARDHVFVASQKWPPKVPFTSIVTILERASGGVRAILELGFQVTAAAVVADRLYFSGGGGLVAISLEGRLLYRAQVEVTKRRWDGDSHALVGYDASGREQWRIDGAWSASDGASFLAPGDDVVSQIDRD